MEKLTGKAKKLFTNAHMGEVKAFDLPWGEIACFSTPRPGSEGRVNEDSCGFKSLGRNSGLLAVADGLGGHVYGDLASEAVIKNLCNTTARRVGTRDYTFAETIRKIEASQMAIRKIHTEAGSTAVAALVTNKKIRFFAAGDSAGLLIDRDGHVIHRTVEHSVTGYGVESGFITEQDSLTHKQSHVILNALGTEPIHLEISLPIRLKKGCCVVLASDGLTDNLKVSEISAVVSSGATVDRLTALKDLTLKRMAAQNGNPDDLTIMLFQYKG